MNVIIFDPDQSASQLKEKLQNRYKLSLEIVSELHKAKEFYSNQGVRTDLLNNVSKLNSFKGYINFVGLYEVKAYKWLERYIPEENKLLTFEELKNYKTQQEQKDNKIIFEYKKTGIKPENWNSKHEKLYKNMLDDIEFQKRKEQAFNNNKNTIKLEKETIERDKKFKDDIDRNNILIDQLKQSIARHSEDKEIKETLKLSCRHENLTQELLFETIDEYLNTINDKSRQIETAQNIIKYLRDKIVKYQRI